MDPLTCLSVAGTAVTFVEFAFKILSETRQLYENGQLTLHDQAAAASKDLTDFGAKLATSIRVHGKGKPLVESEVALESLCRECVELAGELASKLDSLKVKEKGKLWKSVGTFLKSVWSKKELEEIEKRLAEYRNALNTRLMGSLRERVDLILKRQAEDSQKAIDMSHETRALIAAALLHVHGTLQRDLEDETKELLKKLSEEHRMLYQTVQAKEANIRKQVAEVILSSLRYPTITERFEEVAEAHEQTFDWIFEHRSVDDKVPWDDFVHWLEHGDGIYWINGKAASGKSTLMKYIYQSPKTRKYLTEWASGTVLRRAGFFFWNSGTKEQRTQAGLLRSLLHDVLQQAPNLIPVVLPSQWASQYASKTDMAVVSSVDSWSLKTLSIAFQVLVSQTEIPMKLCLFIDGLDEYDGSDLDIAKLFGDVVVSTHVKVCTSSRPHVVFEDAFSKRPQLRLQDLTSDDIRRYVLDRLVGDPMMEQMACKEPARCTELVSEIVGNADGVFLWVTLVVTSLLNGLANGDRISHLQKRLKTLPKDLTALYKHMVLMVDEVYQEEASQIYQIIYAAAEQPGDIVPAKPPTILLLSFAMADDPDLVFTADFDFLTETDILQQCKSMDTMLRTRCGGLIETQFAGSGAANPTPWMKVSYLHRTVRDFLETKEIQAIIKEHSADYNPNIALLKGAILQLKVSRVGRHLGLGFTDKAAVLAQARTYLCRGDDAKYAKLGDIFAEFFKVGSKLDDGNRHSPFSSTQHLADACRMQVPKQKIMEIRQSKPVGQRWLWR